jgi:hypothetical protein
MFKVLRLTCMYNVVPWFSKLQVLELSQLGNWMLRIWAFTIRQCPSSVIFYGSYRCFMLIYNLFTPRYSWNSQILLMLALTTNQSSVINFPDLKIWAKLNQTFEGWPMIVVSLSEIYQLTSPSIDLWLTPTLAVFDYFSYIVAWTNCILT